MDLHGASITEADLAAHSLSTAICSFQDAFAYLIQENDR